MLTVTAQQALTEVMSIASRGMTLTCTQKCWSGASRIGKAEDHMSMRLIHSLCGVLGEETDGRS